MVMAELVEHHGSFLSCSGSPVRSLLVLLTLSYMLMLSFCSSWNPTQLTVEDACLFRVPRVTGGKAGSFPASVLFRCFDAPLLLDSQLISGDKEKWLLLLIFLIALHLRFL